MPRDSLFIPEDEPHYPLPFEEDSESDKEPLIPERKPVAPRKQFLWTRKDDYKTSPTARADKMPKQDTKKALSRIEDIKGVDDILGAAMRNHKPKKEAPAPTPRDQRQGSPSRKSQHTTRLLDLPESHERSFAGGVPAVRDCAPERARTGELKQTQLPARHQQPQRKRARKEDLKGCPRPQKRIHRKWSEDDVRTAREGTSSSEKLLELFGSDHDEI